MKHLFFLGIALALSAPAAVRADAKEREWLFVYTKSLLDSDDARALPRALAEQAREGDVAIRGRHIRVTMPSGRKVVMSFLVERRAREFYEKKMLSGNVVDVSHCGFPARRIRTEKDPSAPRCSSNTYIMEYDCMLIGLKAQISQESALSKRSRYRVIGPEYEDILETRYECAATPEEGKKT